MGTSSWHGALTGMGKPSAQSSWGYIEYWNDFIYDFMRFNHHSVNSKKNILSWKFLSPNPQLPRRARRTRAYCHTIPIRKWGTWTSTSWSFFSVDNLNMSCIFYTCIRATALFQRSSLLALGLFCLLWSVQLMPDFSPAIFNYPQLWLGAGCLPFVPTPIFWVWFQVWFLGSRCSKVLISTSNTDYSRNLGTPRRASKHCFWAATLLESWHFRCRDQGENAATPYNSYNQM